MGDLEQALKYKAKALELSIEQYGLIHSATSREYNNVAIIYSKLGRYDDAISSLNEAIAINIDLYGELSARIANNYDTFGEIYLDKGDFELALQYYAKARADFVALFDEDHPGVKTADKGIAKARDQLDI
jgi:tetratricopeptide (TPR) repeat protein